MPELPVESDITLTPWWEPKALQEGECWRAGVGPLLLYLQRSAQEWLLASENLADSVENYRVISEPLEAMPTAVETSRFVFKKTPQRFCLKPRLLDRPVVVKSHQPVHVPPGEHITFYISSPVCVAVEFSEPVVVAREFPSLRLSDTWFGPSTREGELCYATHTQARNSREDLPRRPHRAVTPVTVHNHSEEMLSIEKLSIPVPYLAVYGTREGVLWTDPVSLKHTSGSLLAIMEIDKKLPAEAGKVTRLAEPRFTMQKSGLVRAFTNIFSD